MTRLPAPPPSPAFTRPAAWFRRVQLLVATILIAAFVLVSAQARDVLLVGSEGGPAAIQGRQAMLAGGCPDLGSYPLAGKTRLTVEVLILCNAFAAAGYGVAFRFVDQPNYARALAETVAQRLDMPSQTIWSSEIAEHEDALLASPPLLRPGEWVVGLFTTADRPDVLAVRTPEQVRRLTAAVPRNWVEDWRALSGLGLKGLIDAPDDVAWTLISAGRADFSLAAFSSDPDMGWDGRAPVRVLPIPGLKLALPHGRHYVLAAKRPGAAARLEALARGLELLRARGVVERALAASGVIEPRVCRWQLVNPGVDTIETSAPCADDPLDTLLR